MSSPEAIRRERGKSAWLEGGDESAELVHPGTTAAALSPYSDNPLSHRQYRLVTRLDG